jgi:hypothetical protein
MLFAGSRISLMGRAGYKPQAMKEGWNIMLHGEKVINISTRSSSLWVTREKLDNPSHRNLSVVISAGVQ